MSANNNVSGFNIQNKNKIVYASKSSITEAILSGTSDKQYREDGSIGEYLLMNNVDHDYNNHQDEEESNANLETREPDEELNGESCYKPHGDKTREVILYTQESLSDLIRNLGLPKDGAEFLASDLKKRGMLEKEVKSTIYRKREQKFQKYFAEEDTDKGKLVSYSYHYHFLYYSYLHFLSTNEFFA